MRDARSIFDWSLSYVGDPLTWLERGEMVRELLRSEGLRKEHRVLEIGCGNLSSGVPLIRYLDKGGYTGLEPNGWLVEAAIQDLKLGDLLRDKDPSFSWRGDFDVTAEYEVAGMFDFAVAHSVLSHAAAWQLPQMLTNVRRALRVGGKFLCSLRLGTRDTNATEWVYPGNSFFTEATIGAQANQHGFDVTFRPEYRDRMVAVAPNDFHDWALFERVKRTRTEYHVFSDEDLRVLGGLDEDTIQMLLAAQTGRQVEIED